MKSKKAITAVLSASLALLILSGCTDSGKKNETETSTSAASESSVSDTESGTETSLTVGTARVPENEADYAIFKVKAEVPEGYDTVADDATGKCYVNGKSKITLQAQNYKEDYTALDAFADSACASFKVQNMLFQSDTTFGTPVKTTVAGFDAIYYDYEIIAYEYVHDETTVAETTAAADSTAETEVTTTVPGVKTEVGRYKGRLVFFYSDEDVFYTTFESAEADYEANLPLFEKFMESVTITKK